MENGITISFKGSSRNGIVSNVIGSEVKEEKPVIVKDCCSQDSNEISVKIPKVQLKNLFKRVIDISKDLSDHGNDDSAKSLYYNYIYTLCFKEDAKEYNCKPWIEKHALLLTGRIKHNFLQTMKSNNRVLSLDIPDIQYIDELLFSPMCTLLEEFLCTTSKYYVKNDSEIGIITPKYQDELRVYSEQTRKIIKQMITKTVVFLDYSDLDLTSTNAIIDEIFDLYSI